MVKKAGPCLHCGINSTPLWRNGPAEKPVLCNACGSRYKLKGTLDNYLPKCVQLKPVYGRSNLFVDDQLSNHIPRTGGINPNIWNPKIPSRRRSLVVYKKMTPMERFQKQLLGLLKRQTQPNESTPDEILLFDNMNNFIPKNEIGLGGILLKTDVASSSDS